MQSNKPNTPNNLRSSSYDRLSASMTTRFNEKRFKRYNVVAGCFILKNITKAEATFLEEIIITFHKKDKKLSARCINDLFNAYNIKSVHAAEIVELIYNVIDEVVVANRIIVKSVDKVYTVDIDFYLFTKFAKNEIENEYKKENTVSKNPNIDKNYRRICEAFRK